MDILFIGLFFFSKTISLIDIACYFSVKASGKAPLLFELLLGPCSQCQLSEFLPLIHHHPGF
jgi:hypothetical protein